MMEAWLLGAPSLVHGRCAVTRDHCLASNGGLFFEDYFEFVEALELLARDGALRQRMGEAGRAYVLANYTWDRVTDNYLAVLRRVGARLRDARPLPGRPPARVELRRGRRHREPCPRAAEAPPELGVRLGRVRAVPAHEPR